MSDNSKVYQASLEMHAAHPAGKIGLFMTKPLNNQNDLALAYSPGVAAPCLAIEEDEQNSFKYTARGNTVAVISNGTAVLGLGDIGYKASKPVMEGKCVLFKRFADIDAFDLEVNTKDPKEFIETIARVADTWGGINLEDIKAPECFIIEEELKKICSIPVFHDDQHGTAIVTAAAMINALDLTGRFFHQVKIVASGAGAAAIACLDLLVKLGVKKENIIICDTKGVIYEGRSDGMNKWKEKYATKSTVRTLAEALVGADIFLGLSSKGILSQDMVVSMGEKPIIFAMANPDPEITPQEVHAVRSDAIVATGRSDYHNQVNNVMCFPYIFRGALDVQAKTINDEMKIAAAQAIANLARKETTAEVEAAYNGKLHQYGPDYIIPVPFDSRLMSEVPFAVAKAAMETGVAIKPLIDLKAYQKSLALRLNPGGSLLYNLNALVAKNPKTIIFADGEEEAVIKAASQWVLQQYGKAILVGDEKLVIESLSKSGLEKNDNFIIMNAANLGEDLKPYIDSLYSRLQRDGFLYRDCIRLLKRDRNIFAAALLERGIGDALVAGVTRDYHQTFSDITKVINPKLNKKLFGMTILMKRERILFISDTALNSHPSAEDLANITIEAAQEVRKLGYEPRAALLANSTFGHPRYNNNCETVKNMREVLKLLEQAKVDFEYDGEVSPEVVLNPDLLKLYPFCRLTGPANLLIMPNLTTATISVKLLEQFGKATSIGPLLSGLSKSVFITSLGANSSEIFQGALVAARS
jgi:malate dehydrogenase (oxaloacetate-decarboxylating)(NADP+)